MICDEASRSRNWDLATRFLSTSLIDPVFTARVASIPLSGPLLLYTYNPLYEYVTKLPSGKHSTMGQGRTAPDPNGYHTTETGVVIPMGKGTDSGISHTSLLYNEYPW